MARLVLNAISRQRPAIVLSSKKMSGDARCPPRPAAVPSPRRPSGPGRSGPPSDRSGLRGAGPFGCFGPPARAVPRPRQARRRHGSGRGGPGRRRAAGRAVSTGTAGRVSPDLRAPTRRRQGAGAARRLVAPGPALSEEGTAGRRRRRRPPRLSRVAEETPARQRPRHHGGGRARPRPTARGVEPLCEGPGTEPGRWPATPFPGAARALRASDQGPGPRRRGPPAERLRRLQPAAGAGRKTMRAWSRPRTSTSRRGKTRSASTASPMAPSWRWW